MKNKPWTPSSESLINVLIYAGLIFTAGITLIPFVWLVCSALKKPEVYFDGPFLPTGDGFMGIEWNQLTLDHFRQLFTGEMSFARNVLNSVFYSSTTAVLATLFSAMGGYALAKFEFRFRLPLTMLVIVSLLVPSSLLLAPGYQLLFNLGLLDSFAGLILPSLASAFGVYLFHQTIYHTIPTELMELARMDGCGEIRLFSFVVLPLVRPMVGAFLMITFLSCWNNFIGPQIILQSPENLPVAVAIVQLKNLYSTNYGMLMAGTLISVAPVIFLFLLLQKELIAGITSGIVKGQNR